MCLSSIELLTNYHYNDSDRKFDKYVPAEDFFDKGLYMFDIGQNDLAGAFYSKSLDQILATIPTILAEFETGLKVGVTASNESMHAFSIQSYLLLIFSTC